MTTTGFSLLSPVFFVFAMTTIAALTNFRGRLRQAAFLIANVAFVVLIMGADRWFTWMPAIVFCLGGYAIAKVGADLSRRHYAVLLVGLVAAFVYMRKYSFLEAVIPDSLLTGAFAAIGLSFILFRVLHVIIEARSRTLGDLDFLTYLNYCLAFTTLIMGPIQRYGDFRDQWNGQSEAIPLTLSAHLDAVIRILIGYAKAYVLADWISPHALSAGLPLDTMGPGEIVVSIWLFYLFLYLDFSGYCDIVIGIGSLMGIRPPENFDRPFIATNVSDFWQRQHRSLTLWLTDYVFTPSYTALRRSHQFRRRPTTAVVLALVLTMTVSGLWHGTTFAFLVFGVLHGAYLITYYVWDQLLTRRLGAKRVRALRTRWPARALGIAITFNAVAFAFVFFQLPATHGFALLGRVIP